jgi:hypothetical protein
MPPYKISIGGAGAGGKYGDIFGDKFATSGTWRIFGNKLGTKYGANTEK